MRWACFIILLWQVYSLSSAHAVSSVFCTDRVETPFGLDSIIIVVVVVVVVEVLKNQVSRRAFLLCSRACVRSLKVDSVLTF